MTFSELIADFGARLNMEIESDADGIYTFDVEGMTFTIHDLASLDQVAFTGDLGQPPPENPTGLYRLVLEGQYLFQETQGATISINPETGNFTFCRSLELNATNADTFFATAEQFINVLEAWQKIIQNYRAADPAPAVEASEPFPQSNFLSGFLQV